MAVTFPDSPVLNQSHQAENGLTYIWDGEKWSSQSAYNITEETYIRKDGTNTAVYADNLGMGIGGTLPASPNISLNENGSGTFTGLLTVDRDSRTVGVFRKAGDTRFAVGEDGVYVGVNVSPGGSPVTGNNISLLTNGVAQFASELHIGRDTATGNAVQGVSLLSSGLITASRSGNSNCFTVRTLGTTTDVIKLKADGSSEFRGEIIAAVTTPSSSNVFPGVRINTAGTGTINCYQGGFNFYAPLDGAATNQRPKFTVGSSSGAPYDYVLRLGDDVGVSSSVVMECSTGNATFAGTVTATVVPPSDAKFKDNITPASPQLADVVALGNQLKNFNWNADAPVNDEIRAQRQLGLIAQEAEKVCPSLVKTIKRTKQGKELTPETTDADGNVTPATYEELDDSYKGISHDALIMKLLGAVAELQAELQALKGGI